MTLSKTAAVGRAGATFWSIAICLCASACATPAAAPLREQSATGPIEVSMARLTQLLTLQGASKSLAPVTMGEIDRFLARADPASRRSVIIERRPSLENDSQVAQIAAALEERGLIPQLRDAGLPGMDVRLVVEQYVASVPGCPDWSKSPGGDLGNSPHSNFGCATQQNLAAMVAEPRDLMFGGPAGAIVGDPSTAALHRYRAGKVLVPSADSINLTTAPASPQAPSTGPSQ
jgi:pilus assembly protein CpaD